MMTTLIEKQYVMNTYNTIAYEFSNTRYHIWNFVKEFLKDRQSLRGLDIGCGNGKNMIHENMIGIDTNQPFMNICKSKGHNVLLADCCALPFKDNTFDYSLCISVIHHLSTQERRLLSIQEMIRVLKPGGHGILNVWSQEYQEKKKFVKGDNYIEWKSKDSSKKTQLRYYHIMSFEMFNDLIHKFDDYMCISDVKNEKGNWVVSFVKK